MSFHPAMDYGRGRHQSARALPEEGPAFVYTAENRAKLDEICARYPPERRKSAILAALYLAQHQQGYLTRNAMRHVADAIGCTAAEVEDVVTYYTMFYTRPVGKYVLTVCRTLSCALMGAERVTEELAEALGVKPGETDASGTFTLHEVECLGACDRAPVVGVNDHWHECQKPEDVRALVDGLRKSGPSVLTGCHLKVAGETR
ncbi:MAG TPA: NAD(P)H-dependent oxidoreductase subunit E [Vicinamibacterales bacterium]|jgi:NADH-quinone oxidoreductase subunit E|nr:NAD(P)H-dependent oxidoreductase subunit E [Vicinamibacterales bacterium]